MSITGNSSPDVRVLTGNGAGVFGAAVSFAVDSFPNSIVNADFNNDGWKDLFIANGYKTDITNLDFIVYGKRALLRDDPTAIVRQPFDARAEIERLENVARNSEQHNGAFRPGEGKTS